MSVYVFVEADNFKKLLELFEDSARKFKSKALSLDQRSLSQWVLKRKATASDIEAADFDADGIVVVVEFFVCKLKEMWKISQDDITPIMDEFENFYFVPWMAYDWAKFLNAMSYTLSSSGSSSFFPHTKRPGTLLHDIIDEIAKTIAIVYGLHTPDSEGC
ncbi:hypothetical protein Tco_0626084 [Tanacetum coccineum]|uniref:Uncharacterized protein n=1 Tax=Tanacetum coccineum TaxID=301880 RepID=A0ABQ4WIN9_9ASTR